MKKSLSRQRELLSGMSGKFIEKNLASVDVLEDISSHISKISKGLSAKLKEISKSLEESRKKLQVAVENRENTCKELERLGLDLGFDKNENSADVELKEKDYIEFGEKNKSSLNRDES